MGVSDLPQLFWVLGKGQEQLCVCVRERQEVQRPGKAGQPQSLLQPWWTTTHHLERGFAGSIDQLQRALGPLME